jgi:ABC-type multidrug transport system fused ATPase/permease subunit
METKKLYPSIIEKSLFSWVFSGHLKLKIILLLTIFVTVFTRVFPLEMQKRIVNQAINLKAVDLLLLYCGLYLAAVITNSALKYLISILQTIIGQRAAAGMRKELYRHILNLPLTFFRRTQPGMVVQSFSTELATAGDFVDMAVAIPVTSVLTLVAFAVYLLCGFSGSGKSTLALCIGQLFKYTEGHLKIDNHEVSRLSKQDIAFNTGFVSQTPFIFDGTIAENLLYGCVAQVEGAGDGPSRKLPELDEMIAVIQQTGMFPDVLRFSLNAVLDRSKYSNLVPPLIRIRKKLKRRLNATLADYVEFFDKQKYLYYSSLAKNLTFGSSNQESFREKKLSSNSYFLGFLDEADLKQPLLDLAARLCVQTISILGNLPPDELFFIQSPIGADELDDYKRVAEHLKTTNPGSLPPLEQQKLLDLALGFIPGRHKMIALPHTLEQRILKARTRFREKISVESPEAFSFYRKSEYIYSHTILNNIFFGRLKTTNPQLQDTINEQVVQLLIEEGILETVVETGMQFQVGSKGDRLSGGQRQKLAIARAFLKKPRILIMDEATSALDNKSQTRIQTLLDTHWKGKATLIAVVHRLDIIKNFDKIGVMRSGKIEEMGSYEELMAKEGLLYELVTGKR